ncbi:MAG: hypothetical protein ACTMIR_13180 [Cellulomonadaceae bacterium]
MSTVNPEITQHLSNQRRRRRTLIIAGTAVAAAVVAVLAIWLLNRDDAGASADGTTTLRIADTNQSDFQDKIVEVAAEKGLTVHQL